MTIRKDSLDQLDELILTRILRFKLRRVIVEAINFMIYSRNYYIPDEFHVKVNKKKH